LTYFKNIICLLKFFIIIIPFVLFAQHEKDIRFGSDPDPCGYDEYAANELYKILGEGWGYNYDSLITDLKIWQKSPFVYIDSVGTSVQGRTLWRLTITDTAVATKPKTRISIHARTHPSEVQSTWVTNEMIDILINSSELANTMRKTCIFNIIPMYNPDGVELGNARTNANNVDLESNWNADIMEPESATLKKLFGEYMISDSPVRVALNMHSAYSCKRYFVYHHETGTSPAFAEDQKVFISSIRDFWPEGIENCDYFKSWINNTPTRYPESWYWFNFQESVMALTYEDMNCAEAGSFDKTALTLLSGVAVYLGIFETAIASHNTYNNKNLTGISTLEVYPNPVSARSIIQFRFVTNTSTDYSINLYDVLGRKVKQVAGGFRDAGTHRLSTRLPDLASGTYFLQLSSKQGIKFFPLTITR